jgi:hypothetical protein
MINKFLGLAEQDFENILSNILNDDAVKKYTDRIDSNTENELVRRLTYVIQTKLEPKFAKLKGELFKKIIDIIGIGQYKYTIKLTENSKKYPYLGATLSTNWSYIVTPGGFNYDKYSGAVYGIIYSFYRMNVEREVTQIDDYEINTLLKDKVFVLETTPTTSPTQSATQPEPSSTPRNGGKPRSTSKNPNKNPRKMRKFKRGNKKSRKGSR